MVRHTATVDRRQRIRGVKSRDYSSAVERQSRSLSRALAGERPSSSPRVDLVPATGVSPATPVHPSSILIPSSPPRRLDNGHATGRIIRTIASSTLAATVRASYSPHLSIRSTKGSEDEVSTVCSRPSDLTLDRSDQSFNVPSTLAMHGF